MSKYSFKALTCSRGFYKVAFLLYFCAGVIGSPRLNANTIDYQKAWENILSEENPGKCIELGLDLQQNLKMNGHGDTKLYFESGVILFGCMIKQGKNLVLAESKGIELLDLAKDNEEYREKFIYLHSSLGYVQFALKKYAQSVESYRVSIKHYRNIYDSASTEYKDYVVDASKRVSWTQSSLLKDFSGSLETCKDFIPIAFYYDYHKCIGDSYYAKGANLYFEKENVRESLDAYELAVNSFEKIDDGSEVYIVESLTMIAHMFYELGQFRKIGPVLSRALKLQERRIEPSSDKTLEIARSLLQFYSRTGNLQKADELKGKYFNNTISNDKSESNIDNLQALGFNAWMKNDLDDAEDIQRRVVKITASLEGTDSQSRLAYAQFALALTLWKKNKIIESNDLFLQSIKVIESNANKYGFPVFHEYATLATFYFEQSDIKQSLRYAKLSLNQQLNFIKRRAPILPRADRINVINTLGDLYKGSFTGANINDDTRSFAINARLNRHGILEEIDRIQYKLILSQSESNINANELVEIIQKLSDKSLDRSLLDKLNQRRIAIEADLFKELPSIKLLSVTAEQVRAAMDPGSVLIEFQRYSPWNRLDSPTNKWKSDRYLAIVLTKAGDKKVIDIGSSASIDSKIKQVLSNIEDQSVNASNLINDLSLTLLGPIETEVRNAQILYISPDSEINNVPFSALNYPGNRSLLEDSFSIRLVTTGREILALSKPYISRDDSVVVFADPDFDLSIAPRTQNLVSNLKRSVNNSSDLLSTIKWQPLPGTAAEADKISRVFEAVIYTGSDFNLRNITESINSKIVHIASHGFFLPPSQASSSKFNYSFYGWGSSDEGANSSREDSTSYSPLVNSGVVLSGANRDVDSGLLTALEISLLDMSDVELVVLSACDTLKSSTKFGQTAYGLRRALSIAGARSSLLSLWKVDDRATANFMESFYKYLVDGLSREAALATTRSDFRNHPIPAWRHPYVWAAFQLSGDWRPIKFD